MAFAGLLLVLLAMAAEKRGYLARLGPAPPGGAAVEIRPVTGPAPHKPGRRQR